MSHTHLHDIDLSSASWYKSSYTANNSNCVEVCDLSDGARAVRDSKNPDLACFVASPTAWGEFVTAVTEGRLV